MERFLMKSNKDLKHLESVRLEKEKGVKHFFSSRIGGVSTEEYSSFNLGIFTNDKKENVEKNFNIICTALEMSKDVVYLNQEHGTKVFLITKENMNSIKGQKGDALITKEKNIPIGVFTADCLPILLYDKKNEAIAAIHAGWRGVEGKILTKTIASMKKEFNTSPNDVICAVGPCIGECCFEVSKEVADKFSFVIERGNSLYVDLLKEIHNECMKADVLEENIDIASICTVCNKETFYSYRGDNGKTGRIGSFIELV